jgi:hypothetical protein
MPPVGFEPTIPASAGPQTYAVGRAAAGIGISSHLRVFNYFQLHAVKITLSKTAQGERPACLNTSGNW